VVKSRSPYPIELELVPLTPSSFRPFGFVIENPATRSPNDIETKDSVYPKAITANQGSALKYPNISPLISRYDASSHPKEATSVMSLFVCSPRKIGKGSDERESWWYLNFNIMERHPYTTQTFAPLGLGSEEKDTAYIVVVAPTGNEGTPDLENIKAFLADGSQAVTYGVGTWHAPMIVIGKHAVPFLVTQYVNGVADDDCQEVIVEGKGGAGVTIRLTGWVRQHGCPRAKL
jgi:ureidoglycolate lyase